MTWPRKLGKLVKPTRSSADLARFTSRTAFILSSSEPSPTKTSILGVRDHVGRKFNIRSSPSDAPTKWRPLSLELLPMPSTRMSDSSEGNSSRAKSARPTSASLVLRSKLRMPFLGSFSLVFVAAVREAMACASAWSPPWAPPDDPADKSRAF
eukprot:1332923-Pyramimonas_sp.AAC.1